MIPETRLFARELARREPCAIDLFRLPDPPPRSGPPREGLALRLRRWLAGLAAAPHGRSARP